MDFKRRVRGHGSYTMVIEQCSYDVLEKKSEVLVKSSCCPFCCVISLAERQPSSHPVVFSPDQQTPTANAAVGTWPITTEPSSVRA